MDALTTNIASGTDHESEGWISNCTTAGNGRLAELWLDSLAAEDGASPGTLTTYKDDLACYLAFLTRQGVALAQVTVEHLRVYLAELMEAGYAETTLAHRR